MKRLFAFSTYPKLSDPKVLSLEALLLALYLALSFVTIPLSPTLRISFSFLAQALSCYYFGFWPNVPFAIAADFFGYVLRPSGAYMPLFALVGIVNALIYTIFFYFRKKIGWKDILIGKGVQMIISHLILNPLILQWMYQSSFTALFLSRLLKNLAEYPIDVLLLYLVFRIGYRLMSQRSWLLALKNKAVKK